MRLAKKYAAMFPVKQPCFNKFSDVYNFMNNTTFALNFFSPKQKSDTVFCTSNKFVEVCSRFCKHIISYLLISQIRVCKNITIFSVIPALTSLT